MAGTPHIEAAAPIVPVRDIAATVEFYVGTLGFEPAFVADDANFAILRHGAAVMQFIRSDDEDALRATANNIAVYLWVKQVDALYGSIEAKLALLPEGKVRPPFTQAYGMREFHVMDPDGCLLFFGEGAEGD